MPFMALTDVHERHHLQNPSHGLCVWEFLVFGCPLLARLQHPSQFRPLLRADLSPEHQRLGTASGQAGDASLLMDC
jgi:hypothetical protein